MAILILNIWILTIGKNKKNNFGEGMYSPPILIIYFVA